MDAFDEFEMVQYELSLVDFDDMTQQVKTMMCSPPKYPKSLCSITYHRAYTPILHIISPPVIYSDSIVQFFIDPRNSQQMKSLSLPEFPWVEVRFNGYGVEFEAFVQENGYLTPYNRNQVRGQMGAIQPSNNTAVMFKFRTGNAQLLNYYTTRCNYQNEMCYQAKAVAKIDSIDKDSGSSNGG